MIDDLRIDADKLRKEHTEYAERILVIYREIGELELERTELVVKRDYTSDRLRHVEKMIERAE